MNLAVVISGVVVIVVITIIIGLAADRRSRDEAWRRIARARRRNWEQSQALVRYGASVPPGVADSGRDAM